MLLMYCLVNQTILELLAVQLIVMIFHYSHPTDLIFYCFLDQIRQSDIFCNFFQIFYHDHLLIVGRGFLTLLFCKDPPLYFLPDPLVFQILCNHPLPVASNLHLHCSFCCLVSLAKWMIVPHLMYYFT